MDVPITFRLSSNGFERPKEHIVETKRMIFVSAEGTCTEPDYFNLLNENLKRDCPFKIQVLDHHRDTNSDPKHVLDLLEECREIRTHGMSLFARTVAEAEPELTEDRVLHFFEHPETLTETEKACVQIAIIKMGIDADYCRYLQEVGDQKTSGEDRFAIVIDRDSGTHTRDTIIEIRDVCREKHFEFCLSNPCFDLWLLLHLEFRLTTPVKKKLETNAYVSGKNTYSASLVAQHAHHAKSIPEMTFKRLYLPKIRSALKRAAKLATDEDAVIDRLGTRVPVLIQDLTRWL